MLNTFFSRKSCLFDVTRKKYFIPGLATDGNMAHTHGVLIPKTTNTLTLYVMLTVFPLKQ
jgi:hypothetical protein